MPIFRLNGSFSEWSEIRWKKWISQFRRTPYLKKELMTEAEVIQIGIDPNLDDLKDVLWRFEWEDSTYYYPLEVVRLLPRKLD